MFPADYVVFDIETTGLDPRNDEIIEIGAIRVRNDQVVAEFEKLIKPSKPISSFITKLTGITNEDLIDAQDIEEVLPDFLNFVGEDIVMGHNVNFDLSFIKDKSLKHLGVVFENRYADTLYISRSFYKGFKHHRLCDLAIRFNIDQDVAHRALADVYTTYKAYLHMKKEKQ